MASSTGKIDLSDNRQPELYAAYISTYSLAVIAVCLRLVSRNYLTKAGLWWDDFIICLSLVFASGNFVDMLLWAHRGLGRHIEVNGPEGVTHFFLNLFISEILYAIVLCLTKFSILIFYWRIFSATNIRMPIILLASIVTGWGISVTVTTIFQCSPVRGFWDKSFTADCDVNVYTFFIGNAVPNIITDWALLLLPIPYIWRLHRTRMQKIALCCIFMLGGFICIVSIIRLCVLRKQLSGTSSKDFTWLFDGSSVWTAVEFNIGIVLACLPSLRPILVAIFGDRPKISRNGNVNPDGYSLRNRPRSHHHSGYVRSDETIDGHDDTVSLAPVLPSKLGA